MKRLAPFLLPLVVAVTTLCAQSKDEAIDFDKARQLFQREQRGERLNPEDQTYLNRAKELRAKGGGRPAAPAGGIDFQKAQALRERTDSCTVPAAGVVGEAMLALVLARACREKFGGDAMEDVFAAVEAYKARIGWRR